MNGSTKRVRGREEARWFKLCSESHSKFCPCPDYRSHFKKICTDASTGTEDGDDAELVAILNATEEVEEALTAAIEEGQR